MPRSHTASREQCQVNLRVMRLYLRYGRPQTGVDVLHHCFVAHEPGASELLELVLQLRHNRRTRRTQRDVQDVFLRQMVPGAPPPPRWYTTVLDHVLSQFRLWHRMAFPGDRAQAHHQQQLTRQLSQRMRRLLGPTGWLRVNVPTLDVEARTAARALWDALHNQEAVLWVDNWYWERFGTDPQQPMLSQSLTAFGLLLLSSTSDAPAQATRSHRFPPVWDHLTLHQLTLRVASVPRQLQESTTRLLDRVGRINQFGVTRSCIRVPLDVPRQLRPARQWRALTLTQQRVGVSEELLAVLEQVRRFRSRSSGLLPLLVDEKVHYSVCRLLYSRSHAGYDVAGWLRGVPLLYGVWHPYKQALALVYRAFFPVLGLLEGTELPRPGFRVSVQRKVLYLEKLYASLLLLASDTRQSLRNSQRAVDTELAALARQDMNDESTQMRGVQLRRRRELLRGAHLLLFHYIPALFGLGHQVRRLTWEGGADGVVKGIHARQLLEEALSLHVQLQGDWQCKTEYTRSLSLALVTWHPSLSKLPGCCFVEESCEAMLSRMVARLRRNPNVTSFDDTLRLFVTLPPPVDVARGTTGSVRSELVALMRSRLRRVLEVDSPLPPFGRVMGAREAIWELEIPDGSLFPEAMVDTIPDADWERILRSAMVSVTGPSRMSQAVERFLRDNVPEATSERHLAGVHLGMQQVNQWTSQRRVQRQRSSQPVGRGRHARPTAAPAVDVAERATSSRDVLEAAPTPGIQEPVATSQASEPMGESIPSDTGSLYEPPPTDEDPVSPGYQSFGDTDSLDSVGELVTGSAHLRGIDDSDTEVFFVLNV